MQEEKTVYEKSRKGRIGYSFDVSSVQEQR